MPPLLNFTMMTSPLLALLNARFPVQLDRQDARDVCISLLCLLSVSEPVDICSCVTCAGSVPLDILRRQRNMAPQALRDQPHLKPCSVCSTPRSVLVRCQFDATGKWHFVCPATCWKDSSIAGGVVDGDGSNPYYRYGGMWKDKKNAVSAKKPKRSPKTGAGADATHVVWQEEGQKYTRNDIVQHAGNNWICRKSHISCEADEPGKYDRCWKEA